jgi:glycosyltransferase involved in cell wall biosynthesis
MRIGIDARELCGKPTGVGRHLSGLLSAWATDPAASRHEFVLYTPEAIRPPLKNAEVRVVAGVPGTVWEQFSLPAAAKHDRLNVFFAPGYTVPLLLNVPSVVLVHDISFVAHPEWFRWKEGLRRRTLTRWSSRRAALVLTVSEAARREILSHFGLAADRVRRIYPGVTSPGQHQATHGTGRPVDRPEPLVLFVGSVFNRRHLPDLIRAFRPIARRAPAARLEIVGDNRTYPYEDLAVIARMEGLESRITIRPYVSDAELGDLYSRARAFALLS